MKLAEVIQLEQEQLRRIQYPLRLTQQKFLAENDRLQGRRIKDRYDTLQGWFEQDITWLRRNWQSCLPRWDQQKPHMDMSWGKQWSQEKAKELGIRWGWDILILEIRMLTNWDFAKANDNKFMLREHLHGFPVMNYGLGEGPYLPSADSQLGGEDFHVILRGDKGDLIYFVPDRNGLEEGLYVECKL